MYILTVCLSPEEMDDDPSLFSVLIEDTSQKSVKEAICNRYDVDEDSFHYCEYSSGLPNGAFDTVESLDDGDLDDDEDNVLRLSWVFDIFDA